MAFLDIYRTTTFTKARSIIVKFITNMFSELANWNDARVTRNALSQLSARELNDIGLVPGDIDRVSRR